MLKKKIIKKIGTGLYSFSDTYRKFEKKIDEIFKTKKSKLKISHKGVIQVLSH